MIAILYPLKMEKNLSEAYSAIYESSVSSGSSGGHYSDGGDGVFRSKEDVARKFNKNFPPKKNGKVDVRTRKAINTSARDFGIQGPTTVKNSYEPEMDVVEGAMSADKYTHNTGGFTVSQKEADEAAERLRKKHKDRKTIHGKVKKMNNSYEPEGEVIDEMRFDDGKEGTKKRLKTLEKKRGMKMPNHPQFKTEEKAPRMQKGAMAYDGPNKPASEAKDRLLMKTKKKREKMQMNSYKPEGELVDEMSHSTEKKPKEKKITRSLLDNIRKVNTGAGSQYEQVVNEFKKLDPVGQEDKDINNDGKKDSTDSYLMKRRKAIGKAIAKKRGKVKEGFSAWRIDLDFNEQVKK